MPILAGEFTMGSPDSDKDALDSEKPQHRVRITRAAQLRCQPAVLTQLMGGFGPN